MKRPYFSPAALVLAGLASVVPSSVASQSYGQVSFQNNTSVTGDLYVDDRYGCGPVQMNLYCVTQVQAGAHTAYVRFVDGEVVTFESFYVEAGKVFTLTVSEG